MNSPSTVTTLPWKCWWMATLLVGTVVIFTGKAKADFTLDFVPGNTFSGTPAAGALTAAFSDVSGGVQLTLASNLAAGENLDPGASWYFNFNPAKTVTNLSFGLHSNVGFSQAASVSTGEDSFKADGDGYYDILFTYSPSTKAFQNGQSQTYLITSTDAISSSDFLYGSSPGGGAGTWDGAVHIQNTPNGGQGSAWDGGTPDVVPEPTTGVLALAGLAAIGAFRFGRRREI